MIIVSDTKILKPSCNQPFQITRNVSICIQSEVHTQFINGMKTYLEHYIFKLSLQTCDDMRLQRTSTVEEEVSIERKYFKLHTHTNYTVGNFQHPYCFI